MMTVAPPLVLLMVHAACRGLPGSPRNAVEGYRRVRPQGRHAGVSDRGRSAHGATVAGVVAGGAVGGVVAGGAAAAAAAAACSASMRNTSSSIALAIGPASLPPVLAEISAVVPFSLTATTYCGSSTGAKATIQTCERSGWPGPLSCAVPVLAATLMPLLSAMQQLAVPCWATPTIRSRRVPAVSRLIGRFQTSGWVRLITFPSWSS